jgi:hypothetical protein
MKRIMLFIMPVLLLNACDPYQLVYIKNYTEIEVKIDVAIQKQNGDFKNITVQSDDTLIETPKALLKYKFEHKIVANFTTDTTYTIDLPGKSTSLLSPLKIGFPINKVYINGDLGKDSVLFYRTNANLKAQLKKGRLKKENWTFFIYNYKN